MDTVLLNTRHQDLGYKINFFEAVVNSDKVEAEALANVLADEIMDRLSVDVDELMVELEQDLEKGETLTQREINKEKVYTARQAYQDAEVELKLYTTMDRKVLEFTNNGASDEEVEGLKKYKKRLEDKILLRYDITEAELKGEE